MYEGTVYFTAQWTPIKYKIAFNSNWWTWTMSAVNWTYDVSLTLPTNTFTKSWSKFKWWSKSAYSSTVAYEDKASVSNLSTTNNATVTLYAVWETCEAGEYSEWTSCVLCPFGYTSNAWASSKSQCYISVSAGKYIETANSTTQKSCPAGTYKAAHTVNYGSTSSCANCSCGYYSAAWAESCIACWAGKWSTAWSSSCSSISAWYYWTSACSATANKCAAGTYSEGWVSSCTNCPSYYTSDEWATWKTSCYISVSWWSRKSSAYWTTTTQCSAWTYREAHKGYYWETTSCKTCASWTSSSTWATSCTSTSTSCTWKYWDVYGGSCTSNATDNCSSSVNTWWNNSANQCSTFHAYCCYKRWTASEREMICKCG